MLLTCRLGLKHHVNMALSTRKPAHERGQNTSDFTEATCDKQAMGLPQTHNAL